jgi:hypothetical protein
VRLAFAVAAAVAVGAAVPQTPMFLPIAAAVVGAFVLTGVVVFRNQASESAAPAISMSMAVVAPFFLAVLTVDQLFLRPLLNFTLSDWFFLAACVIAIGTPGVVRASAPPRPFLIGVGLFMLGAAISSFSSLSPFGSLASASFFVPLTIALFWLSRLVLSNALRIKGAVLCWGISAAASGVVAIIQLRTGSFLSPVSVVYGRAIGMAQHVEDLGGSTAVVLPALLWLTAARSVSARVRGFAFFALLVSAAGPILAGSLTGMAAAIVGGVAYLLLTKRLGLIALIVVVTAIGVRVVYDFQVTNGGLTPTARLREVQGHQGTIASRLDTYRLAIKSIDRNPLVGHGFVNADRKLSNGLEPHDMSLNVWYSGGALSIIGFWVILAAVFWHGRRVLAARSRGSDGHSLALALMCSFATYLTFGIAEPSVHTRYGWLPAALLFAMRPVRPRPDEL